MKVQAVSYHKSANKQNSILFSLQFIASLTCNAHSFIICFPLMPGNFICRGEVKSAKMCFDIVTFWGKIGALLKENLLVDMCIVHKYSKLHLLSKYPFTQNHILSIKNVHIKTKLLDYAEELRSRANKHLKKNTLEFRHSFWKESL
jgi:hypothetical protein